MKLTEILKSNKTKKATISKTEKDTNDIDFDEMFESNIIEGIDRLGNYHRDTKSDEKYGIFVDGKLKRTYWGEDAAKRMLPEFKKRFPDSTLSIKPVQ